MADPTGDSFLGFVDGGPNYLQYQRQFILFHKSEDTAMPCPYGHHILGHRVLIYEATHPIMDNFGEGIVFSNVFSV